MLRLLALRPLVPALPHLLRYFSVTQRRRVLRAFGGEEPDLLDLAPPRPPPPHPGLGGAAAPALDGAEEAEAEAEEEEEEEGEATASFAEEEGDGEEGWDPHADSDSGSEGEGEGAQRNPLLPMIRNYYKRSINPPAALARGVDSILQGRNHAALNLHWGDMARSLKERNVSLMASLRKAAKLAEAQRSGALNEISPAAITTDSPPLLYGPNETLAYVLHGLYPSYGVALRLLREAAEALPGGAWQPRTMLDLGTGPGTAIWAARTVFPDTLFDFVAVEPSRSMMQVAEHLCADLPGVMYRRSWEEVERYHRGKRYDIVMAHYTLGQMCTDGDRERAVAALWDAVAPGGVLILSEHGDRWGFHCIRRARDTLLDRATALANFMARWKPPATAGALGEGGGGGGGLLEGGEGETEEEIQAAMMREMHAPTPPRALADLRPPLPAPSANPRPPLPTVAQVKRYLKAFSSQNALLTGGRTLRPGGDTLGMAVIGPCAHAAPCPMPSNSWCHLSQAVARHRKAGRSSVGRGLGRAWEKYSYVTLRKTTEGAVEEQHAPTARAGWWWQDGSASGAGAGDATFSLLAEDAAAALGGRGKEGGEEEGEEEEEEMGGKAGFQRRKAERQQRDAERSASVGKTEAAVLQLTKQYLQPDAWWLLKRPRAASEGEREGEGEGEGEGGEEGQGSAKLLSASAPAPASSMAALMRTVPQGAGGGRQRRNRTSSLPSAAGAGAAAAALSLGPPGTNAGLYEQLERADARALALASSAPRASPGGDPDTPPPHHHPWMPLWQTPLPVAARGRGSGRGWCARQSSAARMWCWMCAPPRAPLSAGWPPRAS